MKKRIITMSVFTLLLFVSNISFGQTTEGREAGGSDNGFTYEPCPVSWKRNNGNGWGVCHGDAQIRVAFGEMPSVIPQLTKITYTVTNTGQTTTITSVQLPVNGDIINKSHHYISYCLTGILPAPGNSQGNIPPAVKLVLEFTYPSGQVCTTDFEE
jgi:hypothetical protein